MCGITAVLSPDGVTTKVLLEMNTLISYRGPDDEGYFVDGPERAGSFGGHDTPESCSNQAEPCSPQQMLPPTDQLIRWGWDEVATAAEVGGSLVGQSVVWPNVIVLVLPPLERP